MSLILLDPPVGSAPHQPGTVLPEVVRRAPQGREEPISWHLASRRSIIFGHLLLGALALFTVFPIAWMYLTSFRPPTDLFSSGLISTSFSTANYSTAIHTTPLAVLFEHSVIVSVAVAVGQLVTSLLAAYAFARFRFRGRNLLFLLFIGSWLVPFQVTMLPNYVLIVHLGLLNSVVGIIVPQLSSAFGILLLRQHLNGFPTELLDAAKVEGQSSWSTLWTIVVPNLGPVLAALVILLFVNAWNEYFWPLLVYRQPDSVIQLGIQSFYNSDATNFGAVMAMSGLSTLPIFVVYAMLQRRVVNAFVRSGLR